MVHCGCRCWICYVRSVTCCSRLTYRPGIGNCWRWLTNCIVSYDLCCGLLPTYLGRRGCCYWVVGYGCSGCGVIRSNCCLYGPISSCTAKVLLSLFLCHWSWLADMDHSASQVLDLVFCRECLSWPSGSIIDNPHPLNDSPDWCLDLWLLLHSELFSLLF